MTNEQLDRLATEKVMGWQWRSGVVTFWKDKAGKYVCTSFSPTTNELHAAMVREKMRADGWMLRLWAHPNFHEAEWIFQADRSRIGQSGAGTPSVCYAQIKAALLAVEAITEEELNG